METPFDFTICRAFKRHFVTSSLRHVVFAADERR
jgi:hypothetical protein